MNNGGKKLKPIKTYAVKIVANMQIFIVCKEKPEDLIVFMYKPNVLSETKLFFFALNRKKYN